MNKYKPVGWRGQSYRHYLAAKKGKISKYKPKRLRAHGIPIEVNKTAPGRIYPVSPEEVKRRVEQLPKEHTKGIKSIEFVDPKGEQESAWAQYLRSRRALLIFSQKRTGKASIDCVPAKRVNQHIKEYVIPHEVGHHRALYKERITDKNLAVAEARADNNVIGLGPTDGIPVPK